MEEVAEGAAEAGEEADAELARSTGSLSTSR